MRKRGYLKEVKRNKNDKNGLIKGKKQKIQRKQIYSGERRKTQTKNKLKEEERIFRRSQEEME